MSKRAKGVISNLKHFIDVGLKSQKNRTYPKYFLFPITSRCNARCIMCNIWQQNDTRELSLDQINNLLDDSAFKLVEEVTLSGGEPTLRDDIASIASLLIKKCPNLRNIAVPTNGLNPERVIKACIELSKVCRKNNVNLSFSVSLDGIGELHGKQRGVPSAFSKTFETINSLVELRQKFHFGLQTHCVITNVNIHGFSELKKLCEKQNLTFTFELAHDWKRFYTDNCNFKLNTEQKNIFLTDLWEYLKGPNSTEYEWMCYKMLRCDKKRHLKCPFVINAFSIQSNGNVYYCPGAQPIGNVLEDKFSNIFYSEKNIKYRTFIKKNHCAHCTQSLWWYTSPGSLLKSVNHRLIKKIMR